MELQHWVTEEVTELRVKLQDRRDFHKSKAEHLNKILNALERLEGLLMKVGDKDPPGPPVGCGDLGQAEGGT